MIHHEEHDAARAGSEHSFGLVFACVFLVVALWPLLGGLAPRWWALGISAAFACITAVRPAVLRPLNILWFRLGMLLGRIVAPVVMGVIFFLVVTPTGLIFRLRKKDLLHVGRDPAARSYWRQRDEGIGESMRNQY